MHRHLIALLLLLTIACAPSRHDEASSMDGSPSATGSPLMPLPRKGQDRIGRVFGDLPTHWIGEALPTSGQGAAKATLVRWWTDSCPFCEASLPAIEILRERYATEGLATVGVYHAKPPRAVPDEAVVALAERLGYGGPLVVDEDWSALERIWLDTGARTATSVSFLVDAEGVIRFVHPGPELHPSEDAEHAQCQQDFEAMERAIRVLLEG